MQFQPVSDKSRRVMQLSTASIEAYEGAVRSSKTITSILDFAKSLRTNLDGDFAIVGRTERTAYRNIVEPMTAMFGAKHVKYNRGLGTLSIFGRTGYLIGANNEASRTKIQGLTLLFLYLDEAATLPESFFNMARTRLSLEGAKMWLTANPEGRNHWLLVNWLKRSKVWLKADGTTVLDERPFDNEHEAGPLNLHRYTYTIDDNPFLLPEFVRSLKASYTGVWYRRFILSEWTNAEGAIYDMWNPDVHTKPVTEFPAMQRFIVGADYGTTNAFAAVLIGLGVDGKLYVIDEWRHNSREGEARWTDAQLSAGMRLWLVKHPKVQWVAIDPSAASFRTQLFFDGLRNVTAANNSVLDGIRTTASKLALHTLIIADHCKGLLTEIPEYAWDPKATEAGEDKPDKKNDHSMDALRYAVMCATSNWGGRISREAA